MGRGLSARHGHHPASASAATKAGHAETEPLQVNRSANRRRRIVGERHGSTQDSAA